MISPYCRSLSSSCGSWPVGCSVTGDAYLCVVRSRSWPTGISELAESQQRSCFSPTVNWTPTQPGHGRKSPNSDESGRAASFGHGRTRRRSVPAGAAHVPTSVVVVTGSARHWDPRAWPSGPSPRFRSSHSSWASNRHSSTSWQPIRSAGGFVSVRAHSRASSLRAVEISSRA